ncbi:hypothetical protein GPECTOR_28g758 [Gonium pectorale]|uniref:Cyclic nucleotide-binding domain-containing protein n=1 Tax=Gonium pectorale TaxID=33097 RepID=A0A150GER7_GONPE|nr:hypothetical protein GPECTOR_28g758 [Gonium pectorale]|eukprot:KXZ48351.1 hypothetical protein GPECTOR_28g758 [Gonium pectorale]
MRRASWVEAPIASADARPSGFGLPRTPLRVLSMGHGRGLSPTQQHRLEQLVAGASNASGKGGGGGDDGDGGDGGGGGHGRDGPDWAERLTPGSPDPFGQVPGTVARTSRATAGVGHTISLRRRALGAGVARLPVSVSTDDRAVVAAATTAAAPQRASSLRWSAETAGLGLDGDGAAVAAAAAPSAARPALRKAASAAASSLTPAAAAVVSILWPAEGGASAAGAGAGRAQSITLAALRASAAPSSPSPLLRRRSGLSPAQATSPGPGAAASVGAVAGGQSAAGVAPSPWTLAELLPRPNLLGADGSASASARHKARRTEVEWWLMSSWGSRGAGSEGSGGGGGGSSLRRRWWSWRYSGGGGGGGGGASDSSRTRGGSWLGGSRRSPGATAAAGVSTSAAEAAATAKGAAAALHGKLEEHVPWQALVFDVWSAVDRVLPLFLPSRARSSWDVLMLAALLYVAALVPLQAGFSRLHAAAGPGLDTADKAVLALFWLDIGVQFRTAFISETGELVRNTRAIAAHYCRTWLPLDLVSSLPWAEMMQALLLAASDRHGSALVALLRVLRLLKLLRLLRLLDRSRYANVLGLGRLFGLTILVAHWTACVWHGMTEWLSGWPWLFDELHKSGDVDLLAEYSSALYLSFVLVVGSDNLPAQNNLERAFMIAMLITGAVLYALIISNMAVLAANLNSLASRYRTKSAQATDALRYLGAPPELRDRVAEYFDFLALNQHPGPDADSFLSELPRGLVEDIKWSLYCGHLAALPLFAGCDEPFMAALQARLSLAAFTPGEVIFREGEAGQHMYVVRTGTVLVRSGRGELRRLVRPGEAFGQLGLLPDLAARRRFCTAVAGSACDVVTLAGRDLAAVCRDHPESGAVVQERLMQQLEDRLHGTQWTWFIEKVLVPYQLHGDVYERHARQDAWRSPAVSRAASRTLSRSGTSTGVDAAVPPPPVGAFRPLRSMSSVTFKEPDRGDDTRGRAADAADPAAATAAAAVAAAPGDATAAAAAVGKDGVLELRSSERATPAEAPRPVGNGFGGGSETSWSPRADAAAATCSSAGQAAIPGLVPHSDVEAQHTTLTLTPASAPATTGQLDDAILAFSLPESAGGGGAAAADPLAKDRHTEELLRLETATSGNSAGQHGRLSLELAIQPGSPVGRSPMPSDSQLPSPALSPPAVPPAASPSRAAADGERALQASSSLSGSRRLLRNLSELVGSLTEYLPGGQRLLARTRTPSRGRGGGGGDGGDGGSARGGTMAAAAASAADSAAVAGPRRTSGDRLPGAGAANGPLKDGGPALPSNGAADSVQAASPSGTTQYRRLPRRGRSWLSAGWLTLLEEASQAEGRNGIPSLVLRRTRSQRLSTSGAAGGCGGPRRHGGAGGGRNSRDVTDPSGGVEPLSDGSRRSSGEGIPRQQQQQYPWRAAAAEAMLSQQGSRELLIALADAVVRREGRSVPAVADLVDKAEAAGREAAREQAEAAVGGLLGGVAKSVQSVETTAASLDDLVGAAIRRIAAIERHLAAQDDGGVLAGVGGGRLLRHLSHERAPSAARLASSGDDGGSGGDTDDEGAAQTGQEGSVHGRNAFGGGGAGDGASTAGSTGRAAATGYSPVASYTARRRSLDAVGFKAMQQEWNNGAASPGGGAAVGMSPAAAAAAAAAVFGLGAAAEAGDAAASMTAPGPGGGGGAGGSSLARERRRSRASQGGAQLEAAAGGGGAAGADGVGSDVGTPQGPRSRRASYFMMQAGELDMPANVEPLVPTAGMHVACNTVLIANNKNRA